MSSNNEEPDPSTSTQEPTSKPESPESAPQQPGGGYNFFQTTWQTVREKLGGASETFASLHSPLSTTNPAAQFVTFSRSANIDLKKNELSKILGEYAGRPARNKTDKDKDRINKAIVKLFNKPIDNQGRDETTYFKSVETPVNSAYPDATRVFESLLSGETSAARPEGISSLAFAFISILSLTLNRDDLNQPSLTRNVTSPYFDLSPLYGSNKMETDSVRTKDGSGMLWPDCFCEDRLDMVPDAAIALLILWNRFHNYISKHLLLHNEDKWKDPKALDERKYLAQDDQIFNLARSITCINFVNIVKEDVLRGLFGLPFVGPSIDVDILHDVRGSTDKTSVRNSSNMEIYFLYDFTSFTPSSIVDHSIDTALVGVADGDIRRRNYMGLERNIKGYFDDGDLAAVLLDAIESTPGSRNISKHDRERMISKIKQGQKWKVCTLNEFRQSLGLKRLNSFDEWNSEIGEAAKEVYGNIDNLELYPGLLAEEPVAESGFYFGRTMTWALITDIVTRIRNDPRFTIKFKEEELTKWGFHDCMTFSQGPFNAVIPKLLQRTLPYNFPYKNAHSIDPFTVPSEDSQRRIKEFIEKTDSNHELDFSRPRKKIKVLRTIEAISKVFNDPVKFPSPYKRNFCELTGGYGNMLGFDDMSLHDRDLMLTLFALFPDRGAAKRIGVAFGEKAQEYLLDRCTLSSDQKTAKIDVIEDVIDATCVSWVCETIYDLDLQRKPENDNNKWLDEKRIRKYNEKDAREKFAACYAYIFRNGESEVGLRVRERALGASKWLQDHLEIQLAELKRDKVPKKKWEYLMNFSQPLKESLHQLWQEYSATGKVLHTTSAQTFLDRIMKATDLKPLPFLVVDKTPHLRELKEEYQKKYKTDEEEARKLLEKNRVVANVIAFSVVISVHFAKVCAQAVDFYLNEEYATERERLVELCIDKKSSNDEIMGYIREAQRIGQRFGLWRDVNLPSTEPQVLIQQGHGYPDVVIEQGDRVFADFSFAHNDSKQFTDPCTVIPSRKINSLQGLGVHKCPAGDFIDETMVEMFRVIFSQKNLTRAEENGQLKTTTLHPNPAPWDSEVFLGDVDDGYSHCPKKLMLEFEAEKSEKPWKFAEDNVFLYLNWTLTGAKILGILMFIIRYISMPTIPAFTTSPKPLDSFECNNPREIVPYTIRSFRPKWFGLLGEPAPIIYHTPRGRKGHRVSIIAIDKRDIQMRYWIDDQNQGTKLITLDPNINCGDDVNECLRLGFSSAFIPIPPGRHTFKAEIARQHENQTMSWGGRRKKRVQMRLEECL